MGPTQRTGAWLHPARCAGPTRSMPVHQRVLRRLPLVVVAGSVLAAAGCQAAAAPEPRTRVVLLGTGTPNADPERQGPATAIIVDDRAYLVDAGTGIVRRAAQAARDLGIGALRPSRLDRVFITHLHSDHTLGLPDLLLTPWVLDRVASARGLGPARDRAHDGPHRRGVERGHRHPPRRTGAPREQPDAYRSVVHESPAGPRVYQDIPGEGHRLCGEARLVGARVRVPLRGARPHHRALAETPGPPTPSSGVRRVRRARPRGLQRRALQDPRPGVAALPQGVPHLHRRAGGHRAARRIRSCWCCTTSSTGAPTEAGSSGRSGRRATRGPCGRAGPGRVLRRCRRETARSSATTLRSDSPSTNGMT